MWIILWTFPILSPSGPSLLTKMAPSKNGCHSALPWCWPLWVCKWTSSVQPQMFLFFICPPVVATVKPNKLFYTLNTSELEWYIRPHGDSSHGCRGPVEQQVWIKKKFLSLFQINQFPLEWKFVQLTLFRCRYLVHALEITVRGRWKPQTRAMERMHTLWCMHRCHKTANK